MVELTIKNQKMSSKETYQCEQCKAWQHQWEINCDTCNHDNRKYLETKFESIINKPRTISFVRSCPCCSSIKWGENKTKYHLKSELQHSKFYLKDLFSFYIL